ncbi:Uncharacterised protein [Mycobacteroides abscessus subsp. abscessus]|nr:Uncharacterised protein [Mycobacteroides abscessus subsp. abscessus]
MAAQPKNPRSPAKSAEKPTARAKLTAQTSHESLPCRDFIACGSISKPARRKRRPSPISERRPRLSDGWASPSTEGPMRRPPRRSHTVSGTHPRVSLASSGETQTTATMRTSGANSSAVSIALRVQAGSGCGPFAAER